MPGWDEVETWQPAPASSGNGAAATETRLEGDTPIDVQSIMGPPEQPATAGPEVQSAPVEGQPEVVFTQKRKRGPRKPKEADLLGEMLKQAQFGRMAVVCHTLFYRAINTPERPCPDLSEEEAGLVEYGTTGYLRHLIETSEEARQYTPLVAFMLCQMIPMIARVQPIAEASVPFWKRVGDWFRSRFRRDSHP
jgi:hypothetical protein